MSAFIVAPDCINCIVTYLHHNSDCFQWLKKDLEIDVTSTQDLRRLALALDALNRKAIQARYGERSVAEMDDSTGALSGFRYVHRDAVAVHKALRCLEYQCSEGDVPKEPLFLALRAIAATIAEQIVTALPAYEKAPWGD